MISTNITIGNQSIILTSNDNRLRLILSQLISHLTLFDVVMNPISKKFEKVPKMFFYIFKEYGNNFDFLISKNSLNELLYYIHQNNFDKTQLKIFKRIYKHAKVNIELYPKTIPRENQQVYIDNIVKSDISNILIDLPPGYGKAEWVENKIRIPNGWKRMGDITIGDEVIAKDGTTTKVTGVYPQGLKEMYKITFQDGRTNICCGEHLWKVYSPESSFTEPHLVRYVPEIINTTGIITKYLDNHRSCCIDLVTPEIKDDIEFSLSPYIVGNNAIHLISEYLNGSTKQRLEVLRGLEENKSLIFNKYYESQSLVITNLDIANDIQTLIHSLGGICTIIPVETYYHVIYRFDEKLLGISSIEKLPSKLEAQCISIEHPEKLYVTQDYIVTHNTLIGFFSTVKLGTKSAILIKPSYLKKWVDDVKKYSPLRDDEFFIIKGGDSLTKLFSLSKTELENIKIYVISMRTITNYFNSYYSDDFSYPVTPYQFMEYTGIANILNDESHKEFESLFKIILWMDPSKLIGMSATMESDKRNMNYFYNLIYPKKHRLISMFGIKKYAHMIFYTYKLNQGIFIPHKSMMGYNHIMFEQNVMKNIKLLKDYVQMIKDIADTYYYTRKNKGEKLLMLFSTIDMCSIMTKAFKEHYRELSIKRYVEKDDYYDMLTGDVVISTNGSTGTAIDIPGLLTAIQTVPISDKQLNIQALGRLREIPGREVQYISLHCDNIQMHKVYKEKRRHILLDRVAFISEQHHDNKLGNAGVPNAPKDGSYKDFSKGYKQKYFTKYNPYNSKSKPKNSFRKNNKW